MNSRSLRMRIWQGLLITRLSGMVLLKLKSYVAALERCADKLAQGQGHYRELKDIHPNLRVVHCQHHYIFGLMQRSRPMAVVAILHERMDLMERLQSRLQ